MLKRLLIVFALVGCRGSTHEPPATVAIPLTSGALRVHAPSRASGVLRVERSASTWLEVRAVGASDAPARTTSAAPGESARVVYDGAFPGTRLLHVASAGRTEELRHVEHDARDLEYRVRLGPGLDRLRVVEDLVEALDARGVALLRTEPAYLVDARGVRRDLTPAVSRDGDDWSLRWAVDDRGLTYPLEIDPAWTTTSALSRPRRSPTLHVVSGGRVVVIGGASVSGTSFSTVEVWDPATGSWTSGGALSRARAYHASCVLTSGKVLVGGGSGAADASSTAEVFDPATGTSTPIATAAALDISTYGRVVPISATKVLFASYFGSQVLDVATGAWTQTPYVTDRGAPTIVRMPSGKVLLAGGNNGFEEIPMSGAELFDPALEKWSTVAPMKEARDRPEAVLLPSGKALVASGNNSSTAEIYDEVTNTWTLTGAMVAPHYDGALVPLASGKVLMVAGHDLEAMTDRADLFDPTSGTWTSAGRLVGPLREFAAALLPTGKVMIAGGFNGTPVATVQLFAPQSNGGACTGPGECSSGFCVDGVCCEKSACSSGQTCGGAGAPGTCRAKDGAACAADADCASAHCADGVCCDTSCTGQCAACNVKGSEGKCVAVPAGADPVGARAACAGSGTCRARCGGVDKAQCTQFPGTPVVCAPPTCADGEESGAASCDGVGTCAAPIKRKCSPYVCGATSCKTACDADADCENGNSCDLVTRKCVIAAACEGEHTVKSPDGKTKECSPFACREARCLDSCTDSSACAAGFVCDPSSSRCVVPAAGDSTSDGGCGVSAVHSDSGVPWLVALLGLAARRRPRRSPSMR